MDIESYEFDARRRWDFEAEDQNAQVNDNWFAHHEPDPLVFNKVTEEEFKLRLPVTPEHAYSKGLQVEHGRNDNASIVEQEIVPITGIARDNVKQVMEESTADENDQEVLFPENIQLKPSKAIHPPRIKQQSVFDRLRANTVSSAGKQLKQTVIQKKHPSQYIKKTLKKKLVLQERQQSKVTTKGSPNVKKSQAAAQTMSKVENASKQTKKSKHIPHYMLPTESKKQVAAKPQIPLKSTLRQFHSVKPFIQHSSTITTTTSTITTTTTKNNNNTNKKQHKSKSNQTHSLTEKSKLPRYMQATNSTTQRFASKQATAEAKERLKKTPTSIKSRSTHKSGHVTFPLTDQPHYMLPTQAVQEKLVRAQGIKRQSNDISTSSIHDYKHKKQKTG